jgi:hypothetical protein
MARRDREQEIRANFDARVEKANDIAFAKMAMANKAHQTSINKATEIFNKARAAYDRKLEKSDDLLIKKIFDIQRILDNKVKSYQETRDRQLSRLPQQRPVVRPRQRAEVQQQLNAVPPLIQPAVLRPPAPEMIMAPLPVPRRSPRRQAAQPVQRPQARRAQPPRNVQRERWYRDDADLQNDIIEEELEWREANRVPRRRVSIQHLPAHTFIGDGDCPVCTSELNGWGYRFPCGHVVCPECSERVSNCPFGCQNCDHDHE